MSIELVAAEYAEGLLQLAIKKQALDEWVKELNQVKAIFDNNPHFRILYETPIVGRDETKKVITNVFKGNISDEILSLILLLVDKQRTVILPELCHVFEKLVHLEKKEVEIKVETPAPISSQDEEKVKALISSSLGRPVYLKNKVKPEIIGGIILEFLGKRWDGSIKTYIAQLAHELKERCPATAFSTEGG